MLVILIEYIIINYFIVFKYIIIYRFIKYAKKIKKFLRENWNHDSKNIYWKELKFAARKYFKHI